ncbi:MAG: phenylacetate--CoA ligase [Deltaproteobacteria bacterium]|nr:phenylacetate--CoA ligase [Deltaproteobacteria bacterium]
MLTAAGSIWDPPHERMHRGELRRLQGRRLAHAVECARASDLGRRVLHAVDRPITSVDDVAALPFTTKDHLRAAYPFGALAVAPTAIARALTSSGTTGSPTACAYTHGDLELWAELVARGLAAAGVRAGSSVHNAFGYGLTTGGAGFQAAAERMGALVVPAGVGDEARQIRLLDDFRATTLLCTPTYALTLLEAAARAGIDPRRLPLTSLVVGGEPMGERLRARLSEGWGAQVYEAYGLSEIIGPGVANACEAGGLHIAEDHFLPEVVDPLTGRPLPIGDRGELVLTTLTREAMPLVRYRTGDVTRLVPAPCHCGRTLVRMEPVRGRREDAIELDGRAFVPLDVEDVVHARAEFGSVVQLGRTGGAIEVRVESRSERVGDVRAALAASLAQELEAALGVRLAVKVVPSGTLPRSRGKAVRIVG